MWGSTAKGAPHAAASPAAIIQEATDAETPRQQKRRAHVCREEVEGSCEEGEVGGDVEPAAPPLVVPDCLPHAFHLAQHAAQRGAHVLKTRGQRKQRRA